MVMDMSKVSDVEIYFETEEKHLKFDEDEEKPFIRVIQESITMRFVTDRRKRSGLH